MDEHGVGPLGDCSDVALHNSILMMSVDATVLDGLLLMKAGRAKVPRPKNAIISVIALDSMVEGHAVLLEVELGRNRFLSSCGDMGVKVDISAGMIDK